MSIDFNSTAPAGPPPAPTAAKPWYRRRWVQVVAAFAVVAAISSAVSSATAPIRERNQAEAAAEEAAQQAAKQAAQDKEAADKAAAEQAAIADADSLSSRDFAKIVKEPEAYAGRYVVVYGQVTQFDSATGTESFLANSGPAKTPVQFGFAGYTQNTIFSGSADMLADVLKGDVFKATVEVLGSKSYETQIGGNTTVPHFEVEKISVYESAE